MAYRAWVGAVPAAVVVAAPWVAVAAPPPFLKEWLAGPTAAEQQAAAPKGLASGAFARAVMRCAVADGGELSGCRIVQESPAGAGVGDALLSMVPKYRRKPPGKDGAREVQVAVDWAEYDTRSDWLKRPSADDLTAVYPTEALKRQVGGAAVIDCVVAVQGTLKDCVVQEDSPQGLGFGGAAIALTPQFLMRPALRAGAPVLSTVRIPIRWEKSAAPQIGTSKKVLPPNLAWSEAPSHADLAQVYPKKARDERRGGRTTLSCKMTEAGRLKDCDVVTAEPRGYGFDTAAKTLAKGFAYPIRNDDERKATHSLVVHLPITFDPASLDAASPVVGKPNWAATPSSDDVGTAFGAVKATSPVRVTLNCIVQGGGRLSDCAVASETAPGAGAAALSLAPTFRLTTWTTEGLPVIGGKVVIPLRYEPSAPAPKDEAAPK